MTSEAAPPPLTGGAATRARILDAAHHLMSTIGLTRTTTKQIAREAGCSEAALYKYFRDKEEIFVGVLREHAPGLTDTLAGLPRRAGESQVADHLTEVALLAVQFYRRSFPMAASLFASPDLLAAHRGKLDLSTSGPQKPTEYLATYLRAEQDLKRVSADIDPDAVAGLLIGACFHRAFLTLFFASDAPPGELRPDDDTAFAAATVHALLDGVRPPAPTSADT